MFCGSHNGDCSAWPLREMANNNWLSWLFLEGFKNSSLSMNLYFTLTMKNTKKAAYRNAAGNNGKSDVDWYTMSPKKKKKVLFYNPLPNFKQK